MNIKLNQMEWYLKRNKEETVMEQAISGYGKAGLKILYTNELRMLLLENPSIVKFYLILRKLILRYVYINEQINGP